MGWSVPKPWFNLLLNNARLWGTVYKISLTAIKRMDYGQWIIDVWSGDTIEVLKIHSQKKKRVAPISSNDKGPNIKRFVDSFKTEEKPVDQT